MSSIAKTKIEESREIRSNIRSEEKEKLERGSEQDHRYSRRCTRARISTGGRNPDGSGIEDRKKSRKERTEESDVGFGQVP